MPCSCRGRFETGRQLAGEPLLLASAGHVVVDVADMEIMTRAGRR